MRSMTLICVHINDRRPQSNKAEAICRLSKGDHNFPFETNLLRIILFSDNVSLSPDYSAVSNSKTHSMPGVSSTQWRTESSAVHPWKVHSPMRSADGCTQARENLDSQVAWTLSRFSARAQVPWEGPWERAEKRLGVQARQPGWNTEDR